MQKLETRTPGSARLLATVVIGVMAGLLIAEAALRFVGLWTPEAPPIVHRYVHAADPDVRLWPPDGAPGPRLVVVGDSYTFGHGVELERSYPFLLVRELEKEEAAVVAFSRPGWNTRREQIALEETWQELAPDLLILGYCLNDAEPKPTDRMLEERPDLVPWRPEGSLEKFLARRSLLFVRLRSAAEAIRLRPALRSYYRKLYADPKGLATWRRALKRISRLARREGIPAVLVIFPIFDSDLDSDYAYRDLHGRVAAEAEEVGFRVLDLLPSYAAHPGRDLALVPFTDPHPSPLAHAVAAREIARYLEEEGLMAPRSGNPPARRGRSDGRSQPPKARPSR